jgi:hypothetical protein
MMQIASDDPNAINVSQIVWLSGWWRVAPACPERLATNSSDTKGLGKRRATAGADSGALEARIARLMNLWPMLPERVRHEISERAETAIAGL